MNILLILLVIVLTVLLVRHLLRVVRMDAPPVHPASHAEWGMDALPSSSYSLRQDA